MQLVSWQLLYRCPTPHTLTQVRHFEFEHVGLALFEQVAAARQLTRPALTYAAKLQAAGAEARTRTAAGRITGVHSGATGKITCPARSLGSCVVPFLLLHS